MSIDLLLRPDDGMLHHDVALQAEGSTSLDSLGWVNNHKLDQTDSKTKDAQSMGAAKMPRL